MLKIECPSCDELVGLPFDAQVKETPCPKCARGIPVREVYVSAGPYTISRDVLKKNIYRYRKLLAEAETDFENMSRGDLPGKEITAKSVKLFISHMKEMLDGCRDSTRHPISGGVSTEFRINNRTFQGKIVNLSVTGLCLDASGAPVFGLTDELQITLSCGKDTVTVSGRVAWSGRDGILGIRFTGVSEKARKAIEACINEKSLLLRPVKPP